MSWRIVTVTNRCKLEHRLDYLVCRGEETTKIHLSEISVLVVETPAVAITASLMCELIKRKIKVIFCDEKHNPCFELCPTSLRYDASGCLRKQINWSEQNKKNVWTQIVRQKIFQQMEVLRQNDLAQQAGKLFEYLGELQDGDITNREGHAAKVYFNALFGKEFSRQDVCFINAALDYGYSILLSAFNREVVCCGYLTNLGLNHNNEFNHFNLSCDLMEPFRPVVDRQVLRLEGEVFTKEQRHILQNMLNKEIVYNDKKYCLKDAISVYVKDAISVIETGSGSIKYYTYDV